MQKKMVVFAACAILAGMPVTVAQAADVMNSSHAEVMQKDGGIMPLADSSVSAVDLMPNYYTCSDGTFYLTQWDTLVYDINWSPMGNKVNIMIVNAQDSSKFKMFSVTGGSADGKKSMSSLRLEAGEYYVAIGNDWTNSSNINANMTFSWE